MISYRRKCDVNDNDNDDSNDNNDDLKVFGRCGWIASAASHRASFSSHISGR